MPENQIAPADLWKHSEGQRHPDWSPHSGAFLDGGRCQGKFGVLEDCVYCLVSFQRSLVANATQLQFPNSALNRVLIELAE